MSLPGIGDDEFCFLIEGKSKLEAQVLERKAETRTVKIKRLDNASIVEVAESALEKLPQLLLDEIVAQKSYFLRNRGPFLALISVSTCFHAFQARSVLLWRQKST